MCRRYDLQPSPYARENQLATNLQNVRKLKAALDEMGYTPDVPKDMEHLTYQEANDIEKILVDLDFLLNNMVAAWFYAGELYAGEV